MIGILLTVLVAALVYLVLAALTGSAIVAIIGAILVLIAGIPSGGFGFGNRWAGLCCARRARLAQLAEHFTCNEEVAGSIPAAGLPGEALRGIPLTGGSPWSRNAGPR